MPLSDRRIVAQRAFGYFNVLQVKPNLESGDWTAFAFAGHADLTRLIERLEVDPQAQFQLKTETSDKTMFFDVEDLKSIRDLYVEFYGETAKPNVYLGSEV